MKNVKLKALKAAFPHTIPILAGFLGLGMAYGFLSSSKGFSILYPLAMTITVFGGSLEYVMIEMLLGVFAPLQTLLVALMIQARHLFYGISMLEKYKGMGAKRFYLIFAMCDESFSINYTAKIPEDVDRGWFMLFVNLLNQSYWVIGAMIGAIAGSFIKINTTGLDFVMTAMFVVIFLEQWYKEKKHYTALIGLVVTIICLVVFGPDSFMIPSMIGILVSLLAFRKPIEKAGGLS